MTDSLLGQFLTQLLEIWQMQPVSASKFSQLASDFGLDSREEDITKLWQLGILRADYIVHNTAISTSGITQRNDDGFGRFTSSDDRLITQGIEVANAFAGLPALPEGIDLFFHPFRLYVLYNLERRMNVGVHPLQRMMNANGIEKVIASQVDGQSEWAKSENFATSINTWNLTVAYAALAEPCFHSYISGRQRKGFGISWDDFYVSIGKHWDNINSLYLQLGATEAQKYRESIAWCCTMIEPNSSVHRLLRLTDGQFREKLSSKLGLAMQFWTMSETLRRAVEEATTVKLPEEDDMMSSVPNLGDDLKERDYGNARLFGGDRRAANEFLREIGLDYNIRVKWYVEGDTEEGALREVFDPWHQVQVVNLRGQFAESGAKGLSFRESLRADKKAGIFSHILLDGDLKDTLRLVQEAEKKGEFVGMHLISQPDVEKGNFSEADFEVIVTQVAADNGIAIDQAQLRTAIKGFQSGKKLIDSIGDALPQLRQVVVKGRNWGGYLMRHIQKDPNGLLDKNTLDEIGLPLLQAIRITVQATSVDFHVHETLFRTDPKTGRFVKRSDVDDGSN